MWRTPWRRPGPLRCGRVDDTAPVRHDRRLADRRERENMRFSDNGYYIERYIKCDNCGVLIYDDGRIFVVGGKFSAEELRAVGTSADTNADGVPDECQDCNKNGVLDAIDIANGTSADVDTDAVHAEVGGGVEHVLLDRPGGVVPGKGHDGAEPLQHAGVRSTQGVLRAHEHGPLRVVQPDVQRSPLERLPSDDFL